MAQEEKPFSKYLFKMSPQYLFQNTLKAGVEVMNQPRTKSFTFLLNAVANNKNEDDRYRANPYNGAGLEIQTRKYLNPLTIQKSKRGKEYYQSVYFSGLVQGGSYNAKYDYSTYTWDPVTQTSVSVDVKYKSTVQNVALGFTIGLQRTLWKVLTIDGYIGAAYQISAVNVSGQKPNNDYFYENSGILSPQYYGVLPKVGVMIGVTL